MLLKVYGIIAFPSKLNLFLVVYLQQANSKAAKKKAMSSRIKRKVRRRIAKKKKKKLGTEIKPEHEQYCE